MAKAAEVLAAFARYWKGTSNMLKSSSVPSQRSTYLPRLLDLFCGAGGAGEGYRMAGFDVTGVDNRPMPRNTHRFILADALAYLAAHGHEYDVIHASPPCQAYTPLRARHPEKTYPTLIEPVRELLQRIGKPYIIENVPGAPLTPTVILCGTMFDLRVYRHRLFETSFPIPQPAHPKHIHSTGSGRGQRQRKAHYLAGGFVTITGNVGSYCGDAMGIDWMTGKELSQAIPPAYTAYVGRYAMGSL